MSAPYIVTELQQLRRKTSPQLDAFLSLIEQGVEQGGEPQAESLTPIFAEVPPPPSARPTITIAGRHLTPVPGGAHLRESRNFPMLVMAFDFTLRSTAHIAFMLPLDYTGVPTVTLIGDHLGAEFDCVFVRLDTALARLVISRNAEHPRDTRPSDAEIHLIRVELQARQGR